MATNKTNNEKRWFKLHNHMQSANLGVPGYPIFRQTQFGKKNDIAQYHLRPWLTAHGSYPSVSHLRQNFNMWHYSSPKYLSFVAICEPCLLMSILLMMSIPIWWKPQMLLPIFCQSVSWSVFILCRVDHHIPRFGALIIPLMFGRTRWNPWVFWGTWSTNDGLSY